MTPLRHRIFEEMQTRNLAPDAQRSHLQPISQFTRHFGTSLERLGLADSLKLNNPFSAAVTVLIVAHPVPEGFRHAARNRLNCR